MLFRRLSIGMAGRNEKIRRKTSRKRNRHRKRKKTEAVRASVQASTPCDVVVCFSFAAEQSGESAFGVFRVLADFQLAENGMPADVDFVPLALDIAERAFVHLAQEAERRSVANQRV